MRLLVLPLQYMRLGSAISKTIDSADKFLTGIVSHCPQCIGPASDFDNRRLGGESDREILMVPVCVILSLGFGRGLVVRGAAAAGVPSGWCLTLLCQIE